MVLGGVISNLLSLGTQLMPALGTQHRQIEKELKKLMELLERIKIRLYDAEEREIRDLSVKHWLKELRAVAYDAEDVLDEYRYEVLRAQVEAKQIQVSDDMLDQIKEIRNEFSEIANDRIALQLLEEEAPKRSNSDLEISPTSRFVVESDIIGREREKEELIDILCNEIHDDQIISVVTIVGTGGIGKTALAQLIYNDKKVKKKFDMFGWLCVSEDFNVQRLTREVFESITRGSCDLANMNTLQENISEEVRGKKVFIVLDNVWNDNTTHWELFRAPFMSASMVKILVTTRNEPVAQIMQAMSTIKLDYLSEEQSWQMFRHYAFGEAIQNTCSDLVEIGKQIMKKCGMLPLAIKLIASLLRYRKDEESWKMILESELWESDAGNEIFQPLQISYARLPTYLKPCFLYCSMFPRDYRYNADDLVKLWISQGYVQTKKIGWEYAKKLWQRSLFEGEYGENFNFTLHDMVHDLARSISRHECYSIEGDIVPNFLGKLHHLYVGDGVKLIEPSPSPFTKFTILRTLIVDDCAENFLSAFDFSKTQKLRVLQLGSRVDDLELHFPCANFKHLRYLSLNGGHFERLPEFICSLYNLQNLTLENCPYLTMLPQSIENLVNLEELLIIGCQELRVLHVSLCQLKTLRKLLICESRKYY
ncbi:Disease resistance protein (CC-NBS-LRR class) family [Rhynchospora pubera]|uniref:Disease resistance protein (CC-NBS-LRR class) family n=1 Tax=Rhynchospora pubera TaxID=906938 RepID=A0AAV8HFF0_9POAL|nr:Disease resistance protein (CC-NBS-LRR class) family [Rhynchospora pubera]